MNVLGIETSCDETSASVVKDGVNVLSNVVSSSVKFHKKYAGIVPEIASRMQLKIITQVTDSALSQADISLKDVGLICVTNGPGLLGSLLIGLTFAKQLSLSLGLPLLGINHIYSHFYANFLNNNRIKLPFASLVISGGHSSLFYVNDFDKIELLGQTQDDACGEAFDKVARILGLGYPGGPLIEKLAMSGNENKIRFGCSETRKALDFSFSGIKTAVLYCVKGRHLQLKNSSFKKADIAASFQGAVIEALLKKSLLACQIKKIDRLVIGGGVAANGRLREKFSQACRYQGIKCFFPAKEFCTDNAAMVAGYGFQLYKRDHCSSLELNVELN
jgi:N6-L-threonylcarbamoyladenine synthase